ncbi:MAG: cell surface protein SprA [Bacteroidia bacterium]|nr:MAG: cell surface protein SprA [Bacteroidia bacterium]
MKSKNIYSTAGTFLIILGTLILSAKASVVPLETKEVGRKTMLHKLKLHSPKDSSDKDSLKYPFKDYSPNPFSQKESSPLYLNDPSNMSTDIQYNAKTGHYEFSRKVGSLRLNQSYPMSLEEYKAYNFDNSLQRYWNERVANTRMGRGESDPFSKFLNPQLNVPIQGFDKIFGTSVIDIKPRGSAELIFGLHITKQDDPSLPKHLRNHVSFDFDEKIQMGVTGSIGDKMKLGINYNTEATFDFENETKLGYTGKEDEIIQNIEAGNVTLPLSGTLIQGSHSLFGLKTELKFGKLYVTSIFSQQKGETSSFELKSGAMQHEFEIYADEYEENRHFFLSHFFRDNYEKALENLPLIQSGVKIEKVEVWVTNKRREIENTRNIVGFMDLAENKHIYATHMIQGDGTKYYPDNYSNNLYQKLKNLDDQIRESQNITSAMKANFSSFESGRDWNKIDNARKLNPNEYTVNNDLGYISLNTSLNNDEVLAVAFEYTFNGERFTVGEFTSDLEAPKTLIVKLLKGTTLTPRLPTWDLMMKNIYSIGAYQVNKNNFTLEIMYEDDRSGTDLNYLPEGELNKTTLLRVLSLDNVNSQNDPYPDGFFDFIPNITINPTNGRIIFPVLEPFGEYLAKKINDTRLIDRYVYSELYDSTQTKARQLAEKNKFYLRGSYQSSTGSEIKLNAMNIPEGSVKVTAAGRDLQENIDYIVDYTLGMITILNASLLESNTPIKVDFENNSMFNMQTKTLLGTHLDYKISDDFQLGGTLLHLSEKPLTNKVNIGNEPISNTIWGLDGSYTTKVPFLTKMIDKLPFIDTKEMSSVTINGEFAQLIPGHSRALKKSGVSYIDDFEGSEYKFDLKSPSEWKLASTPQGQIMFPEGNLTDTLTVGYNRAKLAWYSINTDLLRNSAPGHISKNDQSNHFVREVFERDLWPEKESQSGLPTTLQVLNLAYYPSEKGPYNYDAKPNYYSKGIDEQGNLNNPETRWGGIMRPITQSDFESANIEYIEFWMMDPFVYEENHSGGELYFNLGNISEDVLRDSRQVFENGLPTDGSDEDIDYTSWGRVAKLKPINYSFDNDESNRKYQDVGLDGLDDDTERSFFEAYLDDVRRIVDPSVFPSIQNDPSNDNWHLFKGGDYDKEKLSILDRYKNYNNQEGNSPVGGNSTTFGQRIADSEDIKEDYTLDEVESYFQYKVKIAPNDLRVGQNYITDVIEDTQERKNGERTTVKWYQFRIPINAPNGKIGAIEDFRSIRFMRMFLHGFRQNVVLRFAKLDLVRGEWRKYNYSLADGSEMTSYPQQVDGTFEISAVNFEENGSRSPINYVLPPGVSRVLDPNNPKLRQLNEQAMVLKVHELEDGDARAAYKNVYLDVRQYKKLKMHIHAEQIDLNELKDYDLSVFIRLGSDFKENYYEYEIPLLVTPPGSYGSESKEDRKTVWPEENELNLKFDKLIEAKLARDKAGVDFTSPYIVMDGTNKIRVKGRPNIGDMQTIMIGIRNPKQATNTNDDDGLPKTGEVWVNELRLTDFNEQGGWAANGRIVTKLADFATITLSGNTSTPGFGGIEKKVSERQKETIYDYSIASNVELGKFFPKKYGVRLPMFVEFAERYSNPQYNPLDPDVEMNDALNNANTKAQKDRNIYSLTNWSLGFAASENYHSNVDLEYDKQKQHSSVISYNYSMSPKNVSPFKSWKFLSAPSLSIIRDFNFFYLPKQISFRSDMNRNYREMLYRDNSESQSAIIYPSTQKDFSWNRLYDVKWDLSKGIKLDFSAKNTSRLGDPDGKLMDANTGIPLQQDNIWDDIASFGETSQYNHMFNATWNVPINRIPIFNWISATARYNSNYDWTRGPKLKNEFDELEYSLGHTIKNANRIQGNATLNFQNLYNKVGFLKKLNQEMKQMKAGKKPNAKTKEVTYEKSGVNLRKDKAKAISHKLGTTDVSVTVTDSNGKKVKGDVDVINGNKITFTADETHKKVNIKIVGKKKVNENILLTIGKLGLNAIFGIKNLSVSMNSDKGTLLPGYMPTTKYMGLINSNNTMAPGIPFILGWQDKHIAETAAGNSWLTKDTLQSNPFTLTNSLSINMRSSIEPLPGLKIDLTVSRTKSETETAYWKADTNGDFTGNNPLTTGNFSMSYNIIKTAFEKTNKNYNSEAFNTFLENRRVIANRLADERQEPFYDRNELNSKNDSILNDYPYRYSPTSQDVLIPAFLAAYSGQNVKKINMDLFQKIPLPNWMISYDGLTQIEAVKRIFKKVRLNHAYRCDYKIGGYQSNAQYTNRISEDNGETFRNTLDGLSYALDRIDSIYFVPQFDVNTVMISEQFSPLINIDLTWNNSLTTKIEYRKARMLTLTLSNNQLMEQRNNEIVLGAGYRFTEFPLRINNKRYESDLNLRADISIKDNYTIIRKISEELDQLTDGVRNTSITFNADYMLNERFNIRLFYEHLIVNPKTSTAVRRVDIKFGFSIRFTLIQ